MPKIVIVKMSVPSGSRLSSLHQWLIRLLGPHRMDVLDVQEEP